MDNPRYPNRKTHLRARWWDYSKGVFFVTTNTHKGVCCFGEVVLGEMVLNDFGRIVQNQWEWLFEQYPYCINHVFVVMPNHFHGLIEIGNVGTGRGGNERTGRDPSASKQIHLAGNMDFKWHRSFHDRIVRDSRAFENIRAYIINNPGNWKQDHYFDCNGANEIT